MSFLSSRLFLRAPVVRSPTLRLTTAARAYSKTVVVERELPRLAPPSKKRWIWTGVGAGAVIWAIVLGGALNHQRLSSSVVHGTSFMVRYDPRVIELIGDQVDYAQYWPWISGTVNHLKGKIDISFDVKGSTGEVANVHFISRRINGQTWVTEKFVATRKSDKKSVDIKHQLSEEGEPVLDKQ